MKQILSTYKDVNIYVFNRYPKMSDEEKSNKIDELCEKYNITEWV